MLTATSKGLPSHHLLSQAWLSPSYEGKSDPQLVKSSPFGCPLSSLRSLSKLEGRGKCGQQVDGGGMGQGPGPGHSTSLVVPGRVELNACRGVSSHLTVLPSGFLLYESCGFWCNLLWFNEAISSHRTSVTWEAVTPDWNPHVRHGPSSDPHVCAWAWAQVFF